MHSRVSVFVHSCRPHGTPCHVHLARNDTLQLHRISGLVLPGALLGWEGVGSTTIQLSFLSIHPATTSFGALLANAGNDDGPFGRKAEKKRRARAAAEPAIHKTQKSSAGRQG